MRESGETVIWLCRSNVMRLMEISLYMLHDVIVKELEFSGIQCGFGLTSFEWTLLVEESTL